MTTRPRLRSVVLALACGAMVCLPAPALAQHPTPPAAAKPPADSHAQATPPKAPATAEPAKPDAHGKATEPTKDAHGKASEPAKADAHGKPAETKAVTAATKPTTVVKATTPQQLRETMNRIQAKLAEVASGPAKPTSASASRTGGKSVTAVAPARPRVSLDWRLTLEWPATLAPPTQVSAAAPGHDAPRPRVTLIWP